VSLNPGMEQDFRDTIRRCSELTVLLRRAINEAISGDKENITITYHEMNKKAQKIATTLEIGEDTLDTFTESPTQPGATPA
jgi:hypothetical protein